MKKGSMILLALVALCVSSAFLIHPLNPAYNGIYYLKKTDVHTISGLATVTVTIITGTITVPYEAGKTYHAEQPGPMMLVWFILAVLCSVALIMYNARR